MRKYRLTILFAVTAVVVIAVAAIVANKIIGGLAEDNLIRIAEENTVRDGIHMEAMLRRMLTGPSAGDAQGMDGTQLAGALTLEALTAPDGLSRIFPMLAEGFNMVKFNLFDLNGTTIWSTDSNTIGITKREGPLFARSVRGEPSSTLVQDHPVVHLDGVPRSIDAVETYLPLREARGGNIIGAMEIYRDVGSDVALQVDDAKATVLWTTVATMGGLFLALFGFIMVADATLHRSRRREMSVIEEANRTLEGRVRLRTRELEDANVQLVEVQEQVVRSEKLAAIGQLAGSVAHDLRNPLGAINNAVYYLKRKLDNSELVQSNPKVAQFLRIVEDEVDHSNRIITDLLSFARAGTPTLAPASLHTIIQSALSGTEIRPDVQLVKQFDQDLPEVRADGDQLHRVFINLIMNAQEAMPEGGDLTIRTCRLNKHAEVEFRDTGGGISHEDMKKVFEPLFTTKVTGTGLGLSVCQQIVSKHDGTIDVASLPGEGASFTVRLPLNGVGLEERHDGQ